MNTITPPPELVQQWLNEFYGAKLLYVAEASIHLATRAAQWGADTELEECCEWMRNAPFGLTLNTSAYQLRAARRPRPSSLKDEAMNALAWVDKHLDMPLLNHFDAIHTIRRALDALPE
jgi:hypothetical protein